MQHCLAVLSGSEHAQEDQTDFVLTQFAFWLLAATDGHAKNFSIQHRRGGRFGLTPLYDVLSAWPIIGNGPNHLSYQRAKLAMGVKAGNMHYRLRDIQPRHWQGLAAAVSKDAWPRVLALAQNVDAALSEVEPELPDGFPSRVWTSTTAGMRRHVNLFLQAPQASL
jgi:serine/threonine-protein kinase HipA